MKPFRYDRDRYGGGLLIYVRERAPIKELTIYKPPNDIECGQIELTVKKQKWILISIYRPPSQPEQYFFREIGKALDYFCRKYENIILIGDFNCEVGEDAISAFMDDYNLTNLVRCPTCFKSGNPRSIDLILTNRKSSFQNTVAIETGLSDFHAMVVTVLKGGFFRRGLQIGNYRYYSKFDTIDFKKTYCIRSHRN